MRNNASVEVQKTEPVITWNWNSRKLLPKIFLPTEDKPWRFYRRTSSLLQVKGATKLYFTHYSCVVVFFYGFM